MMLLLLFDDDDGAALVVGDAITLRAPAAMTRLVVRPVVAALDAPRVTARLHAER